MTFAIMSIISAYAYDVEVDGIYYNLITKAKQAIITNSGSYGDYSGNVSLPETITYNGTIYTVTAIADEAFQYCYNLKSVIIPQTIISIGASSFSRCDGLSSITIPEKVTTIGDYAFYGCSGLCLLNIPKSVTKIGYYAFRECTKLVTVSIPENGLYIGGGAFEDCSSISSLTIPKNTHIEYDAFKSCSNLLSVIISGNYIGNNAFNGCTSLKIISLDLSENLPSISSGSFANCPNLETITINTENEITNFNSTNTDAFDGSYIEYATLNIPENSINNIAGTVWANFGTINAIKNYIADGTCGDNATWKLQDTGKLTISGTSAIYDYTATNPAPWNEYLSSIKQVIVEDGITHIGDYTFANCGELESITIPKSVISIGEGFINGCSTLTKIEIDADNSNYISVDNVLFSTDMKELVACPGGSNNVLVIPSTVETINNKALNGCSKLIGIKCKISTPLVLASDIFADIDKTNCILYVPFKADKILYEAAEYWKEFSNIETIALELADDATTFKADTFEPGYTTYTRTGDAIVEDKYGSFCLPFSIDLSKTDCFKKVYTPIDAVLYNTNTSNLCLMFKTNALDSTIPAGTPFIGLLNGNDVLVQNKVSVTYTGAETNPDMKELTVFNYSGDGALWEKEDMTVSYGGTYAKTEVTADGVYSFSSTGNFGDKAIGTFLSPFRAYINVTASSAKVKDVELWLDDNKATDMENIIANNHSNSNVDVYNMNGMKVRSNVPAGLATQGLLRGLYIVNGQKVLIK